MTEIVRAVAHAPGGIGNLGPGLDVLGAAVVGASDAVSAEWHGPAGITILEAGDPELPSEVHRHSSSLAGLAVMAAAAQQGIVPKHGIGLRVSKGLPLSAGQGGSAASAVAGAAAVNALLGGPLDAAALLAAALVAEEAVAGRHLDNVAPSLLGGVVLVRSIEPIDVICLPIVPTLRFVLVHPAQKLRTADARAVLPAVVAREVALHQMAQVATMVAALYEGDAERFGRAIDDRIAEPVREPLMPGFAQAKQAALAAGAYGASISGGGPSVFAVCEGDRLAGEVAIAMHEAYVGAGIAATARVTSLDPHGTRVECFDADGVVVRTPALRGGGNVSLRRESR